MIKKDDTKKYIYEKLRRATKADERLREIPRQSFYDSKSDYFRFLERRNENINDIIKEINEYGYNIPEVRIHQININTSLSQIRNCLFDMKKKKILAI